MPMKFSDYIHQAWSTHATDPKKTAEGFKTNFSLMETEDDVMKMSHLIVHVCGEHLGDWLLGLELLKKIKNNAKISDKAMMNRYVAILELGNNPYFKIDHFSPSDQASIYATTASALSNLGGMKNASKFLETSFTLLEGLTPNDPANNKLAAAAHNIACALEEKHERSESEIELMLKAASISHASWKKVGTWLEIERAEYRLAMSQLKAQNYEAALIHALTCQKIIQENGSVPLENFFASEVLILVYTKLNDLEKIESIKKEISHFFNQLSSDDQAWCKKTLEQLS